MKFSSSPRVVSDDSLKRMMYRNMPDKAFLFLVAAYERREVAQCVEKEVGAYLVGNGVVLAAEVLYPEHLDLFFMPAFLVDHQYDAADQ